MSRETIFWLIWYSFVMRSLFRHMIWVIECRLTHNQNGQKFQNEIQIMTSNREPQLEPIKWICIICFNCFHINVNIQWLKRSDVKVHSV